MSVLTPGARLFPHTMAIAESFAFLHHINNIKTQISNDHGANPSWVKVTTITITSSFKKAIDLESIRRFFSDKKTLSIKTTHSNYKFIWKISDTTFFNQVSIYCDDHRSRKSVKLFPNGSIQVAGCSDMIDCERVLKQVNCVIGHITKQRLQAQEFQVHMINSNFSLNKFVNLANVFTAFTRGGHDVTFNPDRYSAVKIKMKPMGTDRTVTVSVFNSGKIIVTGAKSLVEVSTSYGIILNTIFSSSQALTGQDSPGVDTFQLWRGGRIDRWLEKI